jgi:hypothetical protein
MGRAQRNPSNFVTTALKMMGFVALYPSYTLASDGIVVPGSRPGRHHFSVYYFVNSANAPFQSGGGGFWM